MSKIVKLTESDLMRIVRRVIKEQDNEMSEEESKDTLRKQLHTLVGSEMRLGKRANMSGAEHHTEEHKKAEKKLNDFLEGNDLDIRTIFEFTTNLGYKIDIVYQNLGCDRSWRQPWESL